MTNAPFRLGINYWPARTAMRWWPAFDATEIATDFGRIAACGFDSVRIFLTWEDFQPQPSRIDPTMVARLVATLDAAGSAGLSVMPTLFTGHMSGVNWIPPWALAAEGHDPATQRFRVLSGGRTATSALANWYTDPTIFHAQAALTAHLANATSGHTALWAWDLGNENSNCVIPDSKAQGRSWLARMTDAIRKADTATSVTLGLHMEDLEQDRNLGPREAADTCDFLTMHGYPGYATWAGGPTDERLLPFLARLTRWLGGGADVLFSEFGVPTRSKEAQDSERSIDPSGPVLVSEDEAATYTERALGALRVCGSTGAMLWCHSDYARAIWTQPPLDLARHERSFGLWRADGSAKPAVAVIESFAKKLQTTAATACDAMDDARWIDIDPDSYYLAPGKELPRLYQRYCAVNAGG